MSNQTTHPWTNNASGVRLDSSRGEGDVRVNRKVMVSAGLLAAMLTATLPAHAAKVEIKFGLGLQDRAHSIPYCTLKVPAGASALVVLNAALTKHCILNYELGGTATLQYVVCINWLCALPPVPPLPMP